MWIDTNHEVSQKTLFGQYPRADPVAISPRTLGFVDHLRCLHTAPGDFQSALRHLRDLPSYSQVFSVGITGDTAIFVSRILSSLLREGLITP